MKIAITAASGQLGRAIVKALINHPAKPEVIGISRRPDTLKTQPIEFRRGDYMDRPSYLKALQGIDVVLLVSGMDHPSKRIQQHRNVIEASVETGVKKIVYTSIVGNAEDAGFSPVVSSNRQTEQDVRESGLDWSIGRNGLYIEPDIEYVENYIAAGKIANCAGEGKCGYTTRDELGFAYAEMLLNKKHNGQTYNLSGSAITQRELTDLFNTHFGIKLEYEDMTVEAYRSQRQEELGDFLGGIIGGIYEGIRMGFSDVSSDFMQAAGRDHIDWDSFFRHANQKRESI